MREHAFVDMWKIQYKRVFTILGLTLLCTTSTLSVYAKNGANQTTMLVPM